MSQKQARISVSEIWDLALPPGTQLVAGARGLQEPVEWVASLRAAFPLFGVLGPGYLALAHVELARQIDASVTVSRLLRELARAQATGFVVDEPITGAEAALADELGLPVLLIPAGIALPDVERDILRTLVDREGQLARREMDVRKNLQQVYARENLDGVLSQVARVIQGQVLLVDDHDLEIAQSGSREGLADPARTVLSVEAAGRSVGQLILWQAGSGGGHQGLSSSASVYAREAAHLCAIELVQQLARRETEDRLGADLVEQLLDEHMDEEALSARFVHLGYDVAARRRHVVIALGPADAADQIMTCRHCARDIQWVAERDDASVINVTYRGVLLCFCSFSDSEPDRRVRNWLREALQSAASERCALGVGRVGVGLSGLRNGVHQAMDAFSLGQTIAGRQSPHFYEELGLYRLLAGLRRRSELVAFYEETLGALARYDAEHSTELVHTLGVFFEQNANASQTSRSLYVHRNTLNYRLQRIAEITGLELSDAEARLAFQLALKIRRLTG